MKNLILLIAITGLIASCSRSNNEDIVGMWKYEREITVMYPNGDIFDTDDNELADEPIGKWELVSKDPYKINLTAQDKTIPCEVIFSDDKNEMELIIQGEPVYFSRILKDDAWLELALEELKQKGDDVRLKIIEDGIKLL